jgi:hypothetical protein
MTEHVAPKPDSVMVSRMQQAIRKMARPDAAMKVVSTVLKSRD